VTRVDVLASYTLLYILSPMTTPIVGIPSVIKMSHTSGPPAPVSVADCSRPTGDGDGRALLYRLSSDWCDSTGNPMQAYNIVEQRTTVVIGYSSRHTGVSHVCNARYWLARCKI